MLIDLKSLFERRQIRPTGILHCGAHWGQERFVYQKFCQGPVVWVEALMENWTQLRLNVAQWTNHVALNACLSDEDGKVLPMHVADNDGQSSSLLQFGTHAVDHPSVHFVGDVEMTTQRVDTLLAARGIEIPFGSFLNIDVQGMDLHVLRGMGDLLNRFDACYIEINVREVYLGCALAPEVFSYLGKFGFRLIEKKMFGNAGWGDALLIANRETHPNSGDKTDAAKEGRIER